MRERRAWRTTAGLKQRTSERGCDTLPHQDRHRSDKRRRGGIEDRAHIQKLAEKSGQETGAGAAEKGAVMNGAVQSGTGRLR